jgi:hypothetical protein
VVHVESSVSRLFLLSWWNNIIVVRELLEIQKMRIDKWFITKLTSEFPEKSCRKRGFEVPHLRQWHERWSWTRWTPKVAKKLGMLIRLRHAYRYVDFEVARPGYGIGHIEAEVTVEYGGLEIAHVTPESKCVD